MKILIAEDDHSLRRVLSAMLQKNCYTVDAVDNGGDALEYLRSGQYDGAILDVMMPVMDGVSVLNAARREGNATPILLLTAKSQVDDKIAGLDAGANDYLTKPFHFEELEARIRSLTRRKFIQQDVCLQCGRISFDTRTRKASVDGLPLSLTRKESSLLEYFLLHQNRIISPEEMIEHIWDGSVNSLSNSIRVHISSLRKKLRTALGFDPIQNKIGQGYILTEDVQ